MATKSKRKNPFRAATNGSVAYDISRSNVSPELVREERPEQERVSDDHLQHAKEQQNRAQLVLREQQKVSVTAIAGFVMVAMLAVGVLASNIQLNGIYASTVTAQSQLTQLESNYAKLVAENEEIFDSQTLADAAEEAGLVKPNSTQQVYLELSDPDNTVVYQQTEQTNGLRGCLDAIESFFGGIGAYFS